MTTLPWRLVRAAGALSLALLAGCGGGGGGGGGSDAPTGASSQAAVNPTARCPLAPAGSGSAPANAGQAGIVSGRVSYERIPFYPLDNNLRGLNYNGRFAAPARGITVEAVAPGCDGSVVATASTDGDGWYALDTKNAALPVCVRARAQLLQTGTPAWNISVNDNTDANKLYVMADNTVASATASPSRNLFAASGWDGVAYTGARVAAPFAILDSACKAIDAVLDAQPAAQFGSMSFFWSVRNTSEAGDPALGKIGGAYYDPSLRGVYLRGDAAVNTDEFDEMVITHEFGHFVTQNFSRSDSIGGGHSLLDITDPRLAFDEGWATAFAGRVLNTSVYRDSDEAQPLGAPNREFAFDILADYSAQGVPTGWFAEASTQRALYNIAGLDGLGLSGVLHTFMSDAYRNSPALATIFSLASQLKSDHAGAAAGIARALDQESIDGDSVDRFAATENHAPPLPAMPLATPALPLYQTLSAGAALSVCSSNAYGVVNALSNRRYLTFTPPVSGNYRFAVQPGTADSVAGVEVLNRGRHLYFQNATSASPALTVNTALTANEIYVLGISHAGNTTDAPDAVTGSPGDQRCFQISVGSGP